MKKTKIHLQDCGQDFLWFIVETYETGCSKIIDAGPFQARFWRGRQITRFEKVGKKPTIEVKCNDWRLLNYPITKIEVLQGT